MANSTPATEDSRFNGPRINPGMEDIAQSTDGPKLFSLLQSPTIQDSGSGNQGRSNTRLLVYEINSDDSATLSSQYLVLAGTVAT